MRLVQCPECKKQVSSLADKCPECGFAVGEYFRLMSKTKRNVSVDGKPDHKAGILILLIYILFLVAVFTRPVQGAILGVLLVIVSALNMFYKPLKKFTDSEFSEILKLRTQNVATATLLVVPVIIMLAFILSDDSKPIRQPSAVGSQNVANFAHMPGNTSNSADSKPGLKELITSHQMKETFDPTTMYPDYEIMNKTEFERTISKQKTLNVLITSRSTPGDIAMRDLAYQIWSEHGRYLDELKIKFYLDGVQGYKEEFAVAEFNDAGLKRYKSKGHVGTVNRYFKDAERRASAVVPKEKLKDEDTLSDFESSQIRYAQDLRRLFNPESFFAESPGINKTRVFRELNYLPREISVFEISECKHDNPGDNYQLHEHGFQVKGAVKIGGIPSEYRLSGGKGKYIVGMYGFLFSRDEQVLIWRTRVSEKSFPRNGGIWEFELVD